MKIRSELIKRLYFVLLRIEFCKKPLNERTKGEMIESQERYLIYVVGGQSGK